MHNSVLASLESITSRGIIFNEIYYLCLSKAGMVKGGGCGCSVLKGGFYPSVMAGLSTTGPYFMTAAVAQAIKLVRNNKTRMAARRRASRRHTKRRRRS